MTMPDGRQQKLEAVARQAIEIWDRWEQMWHEKEEILKAGKDMPSWPRDKFEAHLDSLKSDAEEALRA